MRNTLLAIFFSQNFESVVPLDADLVTLDGPRSVPTVLLESGTVDVIHHEL